MDAATAWLKGIHIATMLVWCAGLFYLPSLFAAHARAADEQGFHRLRAMTQFSYIAVASPAAILAVISGSALIYLTGQHGGWLALKLTVVGLMVAFHVYCGRVLADLRVRPVERRAGSMSALVIVPTILVPLVLWLVMGKPV